MFKKNLRVLASYALGIISSVFLSLCLGAVWDFSRIFFSTVTGIIAIYLMYSELWKTGKYDKVKNIVSLKRPFAATLGYFAIALLLEASVAICKATGAATVLWYFLAAGMIWEYPFTGFYSDSYFLVSTPIITAVVMTFCFIGYYMGVHGISLLDNFSVWKSQKNEEARIKHEKEVEKIKEQYRDM